MKRLVRKLCFLALLSLPTFSTGCATHTGEGVLLGSLLGAGAGAILGGAAGDSGAGALIGAGSGAVLGGLVGNSYDAYDQGYARGYAARPPAHPHYYRPYVERREYHHYHPYGPSWGPPPPSHYYYEERRYSYHPPSWGFRYDHYRY